MARVEKLMFDGVEILKIDYTDIKQDEMIRVMKLAKETIVRDQRPVLLFCVFSRRNYVTPSFIREFERDYKEVEKFVWKNAVVGLSDIQRWILKGVNLWTKRQILHFETREEAIEYLLEDKK